ncbi:hypothetical protein [Streptomyces broussonetiae]|uniref:hypothetical protein n=1 Tax=Streptomyces broussonetiae TaxID=2686304 RepID=UPI0035E30928
MHVVAAVALAAFPAVTGVMYMVTSGCLRTLVPVRLGTGRLLVTVAVARSAA